MEQETKKCPYCGEMIALEAKKCRYCGEWLEDATQASEQELSQEPLVEEQAPSGNNAEEQLDASTTNEPNQEDIATPEEQAQFAYLKAKAGIHNNVLSAVLKYSLYTLYFVGFAIFTCWLMDEKFSLDAVFDFAGTRSYGGGRTTFYSAIFKVIAPIACLLNSFVIPFILVHLVRVTNRINSCMSIDYQAPANIGKATYWLMLVVTILLVLPEIAGDDGFGIMLSILALLLVIASMVIAIIWSIKQHQAWSKLNNKEITGLATTWKIYCIGSAILVILGLILQSTGSIFCYDFAELLEVALDAFLIYQFKLYIE